MQLKRRVRKDPAESWDPITVIIKKDNRHHSVQFNMNCYEVQEKMLSSGDIIRAWRSPEGMFRIRSMNYHQVEINPPLKSGIVITLLRDHLIK